jgi:hypothetical protein
MKVKSITLSDMHSDPKSDSDAIEDRLFRVERITDSVEYHTGQYLARKEVKRLCAERDWKVTIVPFKL